MSSTDPARALLEQAPAAGSAQLGSHHVGIRSIQLASGAGCGPTPLAAYDAALRDAGIAGFNLIYLSSVIPPMSRIEVSADDRAQVDGEWGDRLYVVVAEERHAEVGGEAWAGIGWVQDDDGDGRGLFVEHHGASELVVRTDIERSLESLCEGRNMDLGPVRMVVRGIARDDEPVCALVAAAFESEPWSRWREGARPAPR